MEELDILELYLKEHGYDYTREDKEYSERYGNKHQIIVYKNGKRQWDVICHPGSYGYEEGKLEIMGNIVTEEDGDSVVGWLTAEDVIKRLRRFT